MKPAERLLIIQERLFAAFSPSKLEIIDDSERHRGHAGAAGGAGHYKVIIMADCFADLSRIEIHRKIYGILSDLIPEEIHAIQITASIA